MGTSGAMSTSNQYVKYSITINQNWQSIEGNYSNVTVSVFFWRTNSGYTTYGSGTCYCKINGTTYSASVSPSQKITNSGITLFSKTLDIYHNADGSKYLDTSAWINITNVVSSNEQGYGEWLGVIPRASSLDSVTCSTSYLNCTFTYKYTPKSSSFYNRLRVSIPNIAALDYIRLGQKSTSQQTATYSLSQSLLNDCYTRYPNATSCKIGLVIESYSDSGYGAKIGESAELINTLTFPLSVIPTISSVSLSEAVSGIYAQFGAYVQGKSKITGSISANGIYGSSISGYATSINGANYTSSSFTTDFLLTSGSNTCSVTVADSRGRTASTTRSFTVVSYSNPAINSFSVSRCNSDGTANDEGNCAKCVVSASISSVNNRNTKAFKIMYKKVTATEWITLTLSNSNYSINTTQIIQNIDTEYEYNFKAVATDYFGSSEFSHNLSTAYTIVDYHADGTGIAFGKVATTSNLFEVNFNSEFRQNVDIDGTLKINGTDIFKLIYPVGCYYWSSSSTNPSSLFGGTWTQITNRFVLAAGSSYSVGSTGGASTVTLTVDQMPSHTHGFNYGSGLMAINAGNHAEITGGIGPGGYWNHLRADENKILSTGSSQSHNNMPPYIVAYCWQRIN